jgi:hypothetical protein
MHACMQAHTFVFQLSTLCCITCSCFRKQVLSFFKTYCRYIHFVKGYFRPVLTKEAEKVISSYYQLQRRSATYNAGSSVNYSFKLSLLLLFYFSFYCIVPFLICSKDYRAHAGKFDTPSSRYFNIYVDYFSIKLSEFDFSMLQHMQDLCSEMRSLG